MNKYSEYFDIDQEYFPEINESSIKAGVDWRKTFPHKTFVELLKATERMLSRGTNSDKKGIWIEGAYGTGKSRIAWTLKNLLDCSADALKDYFGEYPALQEQPDLRDKRKRRFITTSSRWLVFGGFYFGSSTFQGSRDSIDAMSAVSIFGIRSKRCVR